MRPSKRPRIILLNVTCLDAYEQDPDLLRDLAGEMDMVIDPSIRRMDHRQMDAFIIGRMRSSSIRRNTPVSPPSQRCSAIRN